ncbi:MAG TPA: hypothetical protein VJV74_02230, partial [Terriglobia bacterium]|nr:hypothetical protein [Terriglobia bacterium]
MVNGRRWIRQLRELARAAALFVLLAASAVSARRVCAQPQESRGGSEIESGVRQAYATGRWDEVVRLTSAPGAPSPNLDYYRGIALARLGRWPEAKQAFAAGRKLAPRDKRFPIELAGVAYR